MSENVFAKTQVFFATNKDHICTRIEHVNHVASISRTIAKNLGLNLELIEAIALGHDLGHSPFGHEGEVILAKIIDPNKTMTNAFWHERNSLRFIDKIETLPNYQGRHENLNLTYAVRDGIVCHCGEVDENGLKPRKENINLEQIQKGKFSPYTFEGYVLTFYRHWSVLFDYYHVQIRFLYQRAFLIWISFLCWSYPILGALELSPLFQTFFLKSQPYIPFR